MDLHCEARGGIGVQTGIEGPGAKRVEETPLGHQKRSAPRTTCHRAVAPSTVFLPPSMMETWSAGTLGLSPPVGSQPGSGSRVDATRRGAWASSGHALT